MLNIAWIKTWSDGKLATLQDLVSVLANAPESVLHTELVRTFIDDFYGEQKRHLIMRGFIPFVLYLICTLGYLTATRDGLQNSLEEEYEMRFADYSFILILIIGTAYFTVLEVKQMVTLKDQYVRASNLVDITYLAINALFIIDVFSGVLNEDTAMILSVT